MSSSESEEMYTRKRIHDLVGKMSDQYVEISKTQENLKNLEHKTDEQQTQIGQVQQSVNKVDKDLASLAQQVNVLNRLLWLFMSGVTAYIVANLMKIM